MMNDRIVYNPMVARRCPRCGRTNTQITEGGRLWPEGPDGPVVENPSAYRDIICTASPACGHKWRGKLTRSERGVK